MSTPLNAVGRRTAGDLPSGAAAAVDTLEHGTRRRSLPRRMGAGMLAAALVAAALAVAADGRQNAQWDSERARAAKACGVTPDRLAEEPTLSVDRRGREHHRYAVDTAGLRFAGTAAAAVVTGDVVDCVVSR